MAREKRNEKERGIGDGQAFLMFGDGGRKDTVLLHTRLPSIQAIRFALAATPGRAVDALGPTSRETNKATPIRGKGG